MPSDEDKPEGSVPFLLGQIMANQKAMDEKLDGFLASQQDHEKRLDTIEHTHSRTVGAAGVVSALVAFVSSWFMSK